MGLCWLWHIRGDNPIVPFKEVDGEGYVCKRCGKKVITHMYWWEYGY